jgi:hypothetical protein
MIFCSNDRFKNLSPGSKSYFDISMKNTKYISVELEVNSLRWRCRNVQYDAHSPEGTTQAITTPSDYFAKGEFHDALQPKNRRDFLRPRPHIACAIDICTWFLHKMSLQGWAPVSKDRITQTQQDGFRGGLTAYSTPIDGLRGMGLTMLHEVRRSALSIAKTANSIS